jgi:hypothetical protein
MPKAKYKYVKCLLLRIFRRKYKDFFHFKFKDGILEMKMHSDGGPCPVELSDAQRVGRGIYRYRACEGGLSAS